MVAGLVSVLTWPTSSVRRRARDAGLSVDSWLRGRQSGEHLYRLLRAEGEDVADGSEEPGSGLILAAHLGPWEAGAAALARRGLRPHVVPAPWPRLPRTEALLADLRESAGVRSLPRDRTGWTEATRQLRNGGTVIALVDSANPLKPGRRPLPFVDQDIAAPDALVAWARRQGAPIWVAVGSEEGFRVQRLEMADAADVAVATVAHAARARPSSWAWVHALAAFALAWLPACGPDPVPPLPTDPAAWTVEAEGVEWSGSVDETWSATMSASRAVGRWEEGAIGRFETVIVGLVPVGADVPFAVATARVGEGVWPGGPFELRDASWDIDGRIQGTSPTATWLGDRFSCGGCPLEALAAEVEKSGLSALQEAP